jgi:hypothetical protein
MPERITDREIDTAVALLRNWLVLQRDAEAAEWRFTLDEQGHAIVVTTEKKTLA